MESIILGRSWLFQFDSNSPSSNTATGTSERLNCFCVGGREAMRRSMRTGATSAFAYFEVLSRIVFLIEGSVFIVSTLLTNSQRTAFMFLTMGWELPSVTKGKNSQGKGFH